MKMWMPGRLAFSTARSARSMSCSRVRARDSTIGCVTAAGDAPHGLEVALGRGGEAGLDHVDAELLELARDHELLLDVHRRARRLLAVAQRRVEDLYPVHRRLSLSATGPTSTATRAPETRKPRAVDPPVASSRSCGCCRPYTPARRRGRAA